MSTGTGNGPKRPKSPVAKIAWAAIGLLGGVLALAFAVLLFGHAQGEEFSPDTFECRSFSYYRIPLTEIQVTAIRHYKYNSPLRDHLFRNNLLPKSEDNAPRWNLVYRHTLTSREGIVGDAKILIDFVPEFRWDIKNEWLSWTQDHPDLAAVLWPAIAELARTNLYIYVPDILELAEAAEQPEDLAIQIDQCVAEKYYLIAEIHREQSLHESAVRYYDLVLQHDPNHSDATTNRELCQPDKP